MNLYCVRHGETQFNLAGRIQGQSDSQLSDLGRKQCQAVARVLAGLQVDALIASPLRRAVESAEIIAETLGVPIKSDERLMEINAGIFQGHTWEEIDARFPGESRHWRSANPDYRIPGGESRRDVMTRTAAAFEEIREAGYRQALIVAHGGSLAAAFKALLQIPAERNPFSLANGSISTANWEKDFRLLTLNETGHLIEAHSGNGEL